VKKKSRAVSVDNVFIFIALIVLNVLVILHFWIAVAGVLIGFIAGAFGMMIGGAVGFLASLIYPLIANGWLAQYVSFGGVHPVAMALVCVSLFCFGGLWMIGNCFIVKYFVKAARWYFDLNVRAFKKYEP